MSFLFELVFDVQFYLFDEWMVKSFDHRSPTSDFTNFDMAICNKEMRPHYLSLISDEMISFSSHKFRFRMTSSRLVFNWIVNRKVHLNTFRIICKRTCSASTPIAFDPLILKLRVSKVSCIIFEMEDSYESVITSTVNIVEISDLVNSCALLSSVEFFLDLLSDNNILNISPTIMKNLTRFKIDASKRYGSVYLTDASLDYISVQCCNLVQFSFSTNSSSFIEYGECALMDIFQSNLHLQHISIQIRCISNNLIDSLMKLRNLKTVHLYSNLHMPLISLNKISLLIQTCVELTEVQIINNKSFSIFQYSKDTLLKYMCKDETYEFPDGITVLQFSEIYKSVRIVGSWVVESEAHENNNDADQYKQFFETICDFMEIRLCQTPFSDLSSTFKAISVNNRDTLIVLRLHECHEVVCSRSVFEPIFTIKTFSLFMMFLCDDIDLGFKTDTISEVTCVLGIECLVFVFCLSFRCILSDSTFQYIRSHTDPLVNINLHGLVQNKSDEACDSVTMKQVIW